jgi:hypothetical protein
VPYPSDTVAAFCSSAAAILVDRAVACGELAPEAAAAARSGLAAPCAVLEASVAAGRITYAPVAGGACVTALVHGTCARLDADHDDLACVSPYTGTVANGGGCTTWSDCANGWCDASATCPGVCSPWLREGDGCWVEGECGPGLVCGGTGTCVAAPPPGRDGDGCAGRGCEPGLVCDAGTATCRPAGTAGAACQDAAECAPGLGCAASGTCQPYRTAGSACDGADAVCVDGTSCDGAACRAWPSAGEPCDPAAAPCLASWCDAGTCRAHRAPGAACAGDDECGPGARCSGTCQAVVCP